MIREKATLRLLSDRLQAHTAIDEDRKAYVYDRQPSMRLDSWEGGGCCYPLDDLFDVDYTGNWINSLHSPQHQYVEGELVFVWADDDVFASVRRFSFAGLSQGPGIYTQWGNSSSFWSNSCEWDESKAGVPITEWSEE